MPTQALITSRIDQGDDFTLQRVEVGIFRNGLNLDRIEKGLPTVQETLLVQATGPTPGLVSTIVMCR